MKKLRGANMTLTDTLKKSNHSSHSSKEQADAIDIKEFVADFDNAKRKEEIAQFEKKKWNLKTDTMLGASIACASLAFVPPVGLGLALVGSAVFFAWATKRYTVDYRRAEKAHRIAQASLQEREKMITNFDKLRSKNEEPFMPKIEKKIALTALSKKENLANNIVLSKEKTKRLGVFSAIGIIPSVLAGGVLAGGTMAILPTALLATVPLVTATIAINSIRNMFKTRKLKNNLKEELKNESQKEAPKKNKSVASQKDLSSHSKVIDLDELNLRYKKTDYKKYQGVIYTNFAEPKKEKTTNIDGVAKRRKTITISNTLSYKKGEER